MPVAALPARYPIIAGPTAGGKTALAVAAAHAFNQQAGEPTTEIISADSMLIYRGLDIGSAKPTEAERCGIPHHLIDIADPTERFTVHDWLTLATRTINEVRERGHVPIVVGGTHLYLKALLEGLFEGPPENPALREALAALPRDELRRRLEASDPAAAERLHPNDLRRTIRALEVFEATGTPISALQRQWDQNSQAPGTQNSVLIGLDWPSEALNPRINARVRAMMVAGLLDEVRSLHASGRLGTQAREGLGYKQLLAYLEGDTTLDEAVEQIKIETRRFAKNQRTWLRRLRAIPGSIWIDAAATPPDQSAAIVLRACMDPPSA